MLSQVSSKEDLSIRIMGVDPGTRNLGTSLGVCDFKAPAFIVEHGQTFDIEYLTHKTNAYTTEFQSRNIAMYKSVYELIYNLVHELQPDLVICEAPYLNKRFPLAYMLLTLCSQAVHQAVTDYSTFIPFEFIDPASAKTGVGVKGNSSDKDLMQAAVLSNPLIQGTFDLSTLDEHTIDSIAIAYNGFLGILNGR